MFKKIMLLMCLGMFFVGNVAFGMYRLFIAGDENLVKYKSVTLPKDINVVSSKYFVQKNDGYNIEVAFDTSHTTSRCTSSYTTPDIAFKIYVNKTDDKHNILATTDHIPVKLLQLIAQQIDCAAIPNPVPLTLSSDEGRRFKIEYTITFNGYAIFIYITKVEKI